MNLSFSALAHNGFPLSDSETQEESFFEVALSSDYVHNSKIDPRVSFNSSVVRSIVKTHLNTNNYFSYCKTNDFFDSKSKSTHFQVLIKSKFQSTKLYIVLRNFRI
jgi:hypothetical protein